MARMVPAFLIDPFTETVTLVEHDAADYRNIYTLISHESHPVDTFTTAYGGGAGLPEGDAIFVDDEGLFKQPTYFFAFDGQPLAGKGLVLGCDSEGETTGPTVAMGDIINRVRFLGYGSINVPAPRVFVVGE